MNVCIGMDGYAMQIIDGKVFKLDQCVVMPATGINTVDGKEIWDGDIVDVDIPLNFGDFHSCVKARGVMVWNKQGAKWQIRLPKEKVMGARGDFSVTNPRVVGDIYQHKYLMDYGGKQQRD